MGMLGIFVKRPEEFGPFGTKDPDAPDGVIIVKSITEIAEILGV